VPVYRGCAWTVQRERDQEIRVDDDAQAPRDSSSSQSSRTSATASIEGRPARNSARASDAGLAGTSLQIRITAPAQAAARNPADRASTREGRGFEPAAPIVSSPRRYRFLLRAPDFVTKRPVVAERRVNPLPLRTWLVAFLITALRARASAMPSLPVCDYGVNI